MKFLNFLAPMLAVFVSSHVLAVTVVPLKNQTTQTIEQDTGACRSQADAQHPIPNAVPTGGRVRGAAVGAVAGATAAQIRGRQYDEVYDRVDDDVKRDYRQNNAASAATAGVVVGGARQRQDRRDNAKETDQTVTANNSVYTSCLQQRGYNIMP